MLRRYHLIELSDLPKWPAALRSLLTDYLQTVMELCGPFRPRRDLLVRALEETDNSKVVDLCSGGAGPWIGLVGELRAELGRPVSVVLSDKYPDFAAARRSDSIEGVRYHLESVDALAVPPELDGMRTIFNGLHHFRPPEVRQILQDVVRQRRAIVVFEALQRSWRELLRINGTPWFVWAVTPRIRPFRWLRILLTYVVPIGPLVIWWDAVVSTLRCYTVDELLEIAHSLDGPPYTWEAGTYHHAGVPVTFLAGYPSSVDLEPGEPEASACEAAPAHGDDGLRMHPDSSGSSS